MQNSLKNNDLYLVYNDYYHLDFSKELNLLYLNLVGSNSIKLYQYLFTRLLESNNLSSSMFHFDLIDNLSMDLKSLVICRKKLEALGLLKTYFVEDNGKNFYIYKIERPLSFDEFFNNSMLSVVLESTIGSNNYYVLKDKFSFNKVSFSNYEEITSKFSDVYDYSSFEGKNIENINNVYRGPNLDEYYFNLDNLRYILSSKYLDSVLDSKENQLNILSLAHLYKASPLEMADAIENSIDVASAGTYIDLEKLKSYMVQLFTVVKQQERPILNNMISKKILEDNYKDENSLSTKEKFAKKIDNINYIEFLNKRYSIILSKTDGDNISNIKTKYNFSSGVINVLLDYAISESKSKGVPNFNYLDKIASTWSRQRIVSAIDAIDFVNSYRKEFKNKMESKEKVSKNANSKNVSNNKKYIINSPEYIKEQFNDFDNVKTKRLETEEDKNAHNDFIKYLKKEGID